MLKVDVFCEGVQKVVKLRKSWESIGMCDKNQESVLKVENV